MARNTSVLLSDNEAEFVEEQVGSGSYGSAGEVISAGLALLKHQATVNALRAALDEGEKSGPATPFDRKEFLARMHAKYGVSS